MAAPPAEVVHATAEARELAESITSEKRGIRQARERLELKATRMRELRATCARYGIELVIEKTPGRPPSPGETAAIAHEVAKDLQHPTTQSAKGAHSGHSSEDQSP